MTRGRVAQVVRFSRDRDLRISQLDHYELAQGTGSHLVCQVMPANSSTLNPNVEGNKGWIGLSPPTTYLSTVGNEANEGNL